MITTCCMKDCRSQINDVKEVNKIRFHRFPLNRPGMVSKWLEAIGRPDFEPNEYNVVCGNHFGKDDYKVESSVIKLKINAIPKKIVPTEKQVIDEAEIFQKELNNKLTLTSTINPSRLIFLKPKPIQNNILQNRPTVPNAGKNTLRKVCMGVQTSFPTNEVKLKRKLTFLECKLRRRSDEIQELRTLIFQFVPQENKKKKKKKFKIV